MRISKERIKELQKILKKQTGKDYSDEEAQQAGLAIIRFALAKLRREELQMEANTGNKDDETN